MKKAGVIHLGCAKNQVDTEILMGFLKEMGYEFTSSEEEADLLLVNTCAFIRPAYEEAEENIKSLKRYEKDGKKIIVAGCYVERFKKELLEKFPFVDLFIGPGNYNEFKELIRENSKGRVVTSPASSFLYNSKMERVLISSPHWAYVKISEGCNNFCSYCTIPYIRGRVRSRAIEDTAAEVKKLVNSGVREINLIAQDTTRYGEDIYGKSSLLDLLKELNKIEGDFFIRILYAYPTRISQDLVSFIKESEKIVPYFEIPLQHVNNKILKNMNRPYTKEDIKRLWCMLREAFDDVVLRTTFMVGFPGETEDEFQELLEFIEEYYFDKIGVFTYYPEEGTIAKDLSLQVPEETKVKRLDLLMRKQQEISKKLNRKLLGKEFKVIIERSNGKVYYGRSWRDAPEVDGVIFVTSPSELSLGQEVKVKITKYKTYDLWGEVV
ncbi:MAG TPA: 30S ribosomal protein S12 methylthiotransferase RimO [Dictyoglomaceae bacterium]|nr:30S ribosomal protein S12 methylthiotransferase RimO [Dictyoglomaceae bacterium]HOL39106.1 30S ribosomal protein S12 methylthiotransferase RimO [Dictyoglomaceae bacterium]HOP94285.1 30S ribosomal protein S12 methylthiotransferase RimO [Dictyoglomaceae bacterium]HPP15260.1 30S ribosomal protein S12 methylthiotransferase RimO [Dictyoglomaceae bacterium]HPU42666.1 30S ribosomal protein S12 methylthiotransferase RimO [Dictyoglomaceae bacterium]